MEPKKKDIFEEIIEESENLEELAEGYFSDY